MGKHNETGNTGERIAQEYLQSKGYTLLHTNWRTARKEIDLIAQDGEILVFIEIKTRRGYGYGYPEEAVSPVKQTHLKTAAQQFMESNPQYTSMRFDVISIVLSGQMVKELLHLIDAF